MGSSTSKAPDLKVKAIRSNTQDIRSSLRRKQIPTQNKENLHQELINNSKQLDTLRAKQSKKKRLEIDQLQKLVSNVSEELLQYNEDHLDKNADESHSFIHLGAEEIKNKKKKSKIKTSSKTNIMSTNPLHTLNEIELKLQKVKSDVTVGIQNDDNNLLFLQKKKIEILSTDLELLNIPETSQLYERQQILEKDLYKYYQRIVRREKVKKRSSRINTEEDDVENEKIRMNYSKLKTLEIMIQDIQDVIQNTMQGDNRADMNSLFQELNKIEEQLKNIEDCSRENLKSKTKIQKNVDQTKKTFSDIIIMKEWNNLEKIIKEIDKLKKQLQDNEDLDIMKDLNRLKEELKNFDVKHTVNQTRRIQYLDELNKLLRKSGINHDGVKMREKKIKNSKSVEDLVHLEQEWKSLEKNITLTKPDDVKQIDKLLEKFEESIRAKRKSLADLMKKTETDKSDTKSGEIIRTSAKIYDLPKLETTKSTDDKKKPLEERSSIKYGTIEYALEEMTKVSDRVEELGKKLLTFTGVSEDLEYNFFKAALLEKKETLTNVMHRSSWNQVDVFKLELLEKIKYFEEYLKYKLEQNRLHQKLEQRLDRLDAEIRRFTGSYKNIQYENIYDQLCTCFQETAKLDFPQQRDILKQRASYLKLLLKEISRADIEFHENRNLTDTLKIITENKDEISKCKEQLEKNLNLSLGELIKIEECLNLRAQELVNLNLNNDTPKYQDIKEILRDIEYCRNIIENKKLEEEIKLKKILEEQLRILNDINNDIMHFDGQVNDDNYQAILKTLTDLESSLCTTSNGDDNLELSLNINLLKSKLEQIGVESGILHEIEKRVRQILELVCDGLRDDEFDKLDEELINLRIQLEKLDVSEQLSYRKIACSNYIEYLLKKINEGSVQVSRSIVV